MKRLRYLLVPVWVALILFSASTVYGVIHASVLPHLHRYLFLAIGVATAWLSIQLVHPALYRFWDTFFHELSHIIFALLTFSRPTKLMVSPDQPETGLFGRTNGYVVLHRWGIGPLHFLRGHLVLLAPYFFAPMTFGIVLVYWFIDVQFLRYLPHDGTGTRLLLFLIGFTYFYHVRTSFKQAGAYQSDFNYVGYRYGMLFVLMMQLHFLLFYLLVLTDDFALFNASVREAQRYIGSYLPLMPYRYREFLPL